MVSLVGFKGQLLLWLQLVCLELLDLSSKHLRWLRSRVNTVGLWGGGREESERRDEWSGERSCSVYFLPTATAVSFPSLPLSLPPHSSSHPSPLSSLILLSSLTPHSPPPLPSLPTIYLDGDDEVALVLEETLSIDGHYPGLVWLCHVSKYRVHHTCTSTHMTRSTLTPCST